MVEGLQANPPSLSNISPDCIRNADMPALIMDGISKQQLLAVWSTNPDTGFTPAQLVEARITIAEMRSNNITLSQIYAGGVSITYLIGAGLTASLLYNEGIPGYALFNEACNTPLSAGTAPAPTIRLISTKLNSTDTNIVLEGRAFSSINWTSPELPEEGASFTRQSGGLEMLGNMIAERIGIDGTTVVSTLTIPFDYVFSNLTVRLSDIRARTTSIQLCPGR